VFNKVDGVAISDFNHPSNNFQLDKLIEIGHAAEILSGPLKSNVTRLAKSKTVAVCFGI